MHNGIQMSEIYMVSLIVHVCVAMLAALAEEMAGICDILIFMSGEDLVTYTY